MTPRITDDAHVTLLLSSHLVLARGTAASRVKPLSPLEWNELAAYLKQNRLRPSSLLNMDAVAMQERLGLVPDQTQRILQLLSRGAQLAVELERLSSLGIWALTRSEENYPAALKDRLGAAAPPVLFGAGEQDLLSRAFLAVVGSRDVDDAGQRFAADIGSACARRGVVLVSGGAKGVDRLSMHACLEAGGSAVGVLADSLERTIRQPEARAAIIDGRLSLVSAVLPKAPFYVGNAMARNKYIYCLARHGLVVASSLEKGGTRAGALEVLNDRWVPLFVRSGVGVPAGNADLVKRGALPFPAEEIPEELELWLTEHARPWGGPVASRRKRLTANSPPAGAAPTGEHDLFPVVWPVIAQCLGHSSSHEDMARHLQITLVQLRAWLARAVQDGLVSPAQAAGSQGVAAPHAEQIRFNT